MTDLADARFMDLALCEARLAEEHGDVPVGAILVDASGTLVGSGHNRREQQRDPTAHAEIEALRAASAERHSWRMDGLTMYVTLEPCVMCAGALVNARLGRLVYGCRDDKAGAIDSLFVIGRDPRLNHRFPIRGGVHAEACSALLSQFFRGRRG
jgi:tRNA(adenine34) deaminase